MHQVQPPLLERVNQSPAGPRFRNAWSRSRLVSPLYALHKTEKVLQLLEGLMLSEMRSKTKQRKIKEVIVNGDAPIVASASVEGHIPPKTAEQKLTKKNELKAKSTLPRFGGTIESKKMPIDTSEAGNMRNFLGIKISTLDKTYDRHNEHRDEFVQQFEGVEAAITRPIQAQAQLSEVAFVTSENTSSTNEAVNTAHEVSTTNLEQINTDDLEEIDLKCRWPGLPIRVNRFLKNIGRNLNFNVKETVGFDNTKVECYKCHMRGHFAREYKAPRNQGNRNGDAPRTIIPVETPANALIVQDEIGGYDWSFQAEEGLGGKHCSNGAKHPIRQGSTQETILSYRINKNVNGGFLHFAGSGPEWLFDIDLLTNSMNYEPVTAGNQTNKNAGIKDNVDAVPTQQYNIRYPLLRSLIHDLEDTDLPKGKRAIGTKWVYRNKKDEKGIVVGNKAKLVAQGYTQEEGIVMIGNLLPDARLKQLDDAQEIPDEFYGGAHFLFRVASHAERLWNLLSLRKVLTFSNSDYAEASLDMKSTTGGCQFLSKRLISWQCKKQTIVANSTTEAEYVAAANCCGQMSLSKRNRNQNGKGFHYNNMLLARSRSEDSEEQSRRKQRKNIEVSQSSASTEPMTEKETNEESVPKHSYDPSQSASLKSRVKQLEKKASKRTHKFKILYRVGSTRRVESSNNEGLGAQEDASKQRRSIEDIDKDAEVSLVDETQGSSDDTKMFDIDALIGDEVFAENDMTEKEHDVIPKEISAAETLTTAGIKIRVSFVAPSTTAVSPPVITESTITTALSTILKAKGITFRDAGETTTRTRTLVSSSSIKDKGNAKMVEPQVPLNKKDPIRLDEEFARRLDAEEQEASRLERENVELQEQATLTKIKEWDNVQAMMDADYELCKRLQEQDQGELTIEEKSKLFMKLMNERKRHFAKLRAEEKRRKPLTKGQRRNHMCTYLKNMGEFTHNQLKNKSYEEIQKAFDMIMGWINNFKPMDYEEIKSNEKKAEGSKKKSIGKKRAGNEQKQESSKRQRMKDDKETDEHEDVEADDEAEMKKHMEIIQDKEEIAIDAIPLATKPLMIVEYKIVKEGQKGFYHLIRADGSSKRPEDDYERVFWGDLKVMFEPDIKSEVWRSIQGYKVTVWKLFDSSGVHFVRFKNLHIFILVEKRYPLTPITITNMLNKKLQADHWNEMCYQRLKLMTKKEKGQ
ncbi:putative ribonuclease H-like domain-containing protein [Tanacetum coccineum]